MTTLEVKELAAKTAERIRRTGWAKGSLGEYTDTDGEICTIDSGDCATPTILNSCRVCLTGAIAAAWVGDPREGYYLYGEAEELARDIAERVYPEKFHPESDEFDEFAGADPAELVYTWNDRHTEVDVLALLDSIATS